MFKLVFEACSSQQRVEKECPWQRDQKVRGALEVLEDTDVRKY
jgi:hypothetical protein